MNTCYENMEKMFNRVDLPFPDYKIEIFSDGYEEYEKCLKEYYSETCINYGQIIKIRENGKLIGKKRRIVFGDPDLDSIDTINVENSNGIFRERIGRLVRKTKCYSKVKRKLESALELFQFYWNFMNEFKDKKTPAMLEGLINCPISWQTFLYTTIKYA